MIRHGGRAGWFRVAAGFGALASLEAAFAAWTVSHASVDAGVAHAGPLAAAIGVSAALVAAASVLAMRGRAAAGVCLLAGYAIPAVTLYVRQATIRPPGLLVVVSMLALVMATARRAATDDTVPPPLTDTT